jgi:tetratricopeptide (TPR) repeat protein
MERRVILLCLLSLCFALPAAAQDGADAIRLGPSEGVRELVSVGEPVELDTFIRTALVFSGVPGRRLVEYELRIRNHLAELHGRLREVTEPREQAEAALDYMHEELLRRYDERQTGVDVLLERGGYNCVSSGVMYAILVKSMGLSVWGVRTADHAFCRVQAGERAFDVETTSPFGFDPGTRKEFTDNFGRVTGYSYVPPSNYRDRRDIGEKELLGLILFNRTAFASERRDFRAAVPPAVDAHALLENEESFERLITSLLNLSSWYGMSGRFEEALEFLDRAAGRHGDERLGALRADLTHNWVLSLIQKGDYPKAEELLDGQRSRGQIPEGEWRDLTVYLYQVRAQKSAPGDYGKAASLILEGLYKVGSDQGLAKSYEVYIHNSVVTLVRNERYEEALALLDEALMQLPDSSVLLKDKSKVLEALSRR